MRAFLGWFIVALSGFFVVAAISDLVSGNLGEEGPGVLAGMAVFFTIVGVLGYRLATSKTPQSAAQSPEQRILAVAKQMQGRVTLAEVVLHCQLETEQARAHLREMIRKGLAELHLSDQGDEVYMFAGFAPETKKTAKDPLD
ncbi:hypothetical protein [Meiothermus ruber]|uniref:hypothetical protein n=1 Tax=Meiothermus ruber TaxID=277 RepID=UPI00034D037F|nr:hypothetical protein [Meiothermus ruber]GAO76691.1 uncharacterized protein MrH_2997 [Meiothermus ruber H328]